MAAVIVFRLLAPDTAEWLDEAGAVQRTSLAQLARAAHGAGQRRWVLVVPGELVTLHQVKLPSRKRSAWPKAAPYALEDRFADPVEDLHCALGSLLADGAVPVAVVRHALLRGWLDDCARAGVVPAAVLPDTLSTPLAPDGWSVLLDGARCLVRSGPASGFACERAALPLLLTRAWSTLDTAAMPVRLYVWGAGAAESGLERLACELIIQPEDAAPLQLLARGQPSAKALNLLQGPYSRQAHWRQWLQPWHAAAALALLWLAVQGVGQGVEYWQLTRASAELRQAMVEVFRDAVPSAQRVVNPRAQLENRWRELRGHENGAAAVFFELLASAGARLAELPALSLRGLRYGNQRLELQLQGADLETFDVLKQRLSEPAGLALTLRTSKQDATVASVLTLSKP